MRVHGLIRTVCLAISLIAPTPAIAILLSGMYMRPDPVGDAYSLLAGPFTLFGLTITPLAIFLYFESNEGIKVERNEAKLAGIEAMAYMVAIAVLLGSFMGDNLFLGYPLLMGCALLAPPIITLVAGFALLRVKTPPY